MYTIKERDSFFEHIIKSIENSHNIIGTYLIGSSSIGFNDIYSDCDFMMAYSDDAEVSNVRDEILSFFNHDDVGYIMERKWSDKIWGISVYMKNGLSSDISFGPLNELKIKSLQISVGVDTNDFLLTKHLSEGKAIFEEKYSNYNIDNKINWEFMYLIRKYLIAIKRNNLIYAYSLLNDARMIVLKLEAFNEGKKLHEFKAYNELDKKFLLETEKTIPNGICIDELNRCKDLILDIFYELMNKSDKLLFEQDSKYLLEIAD